MLKNDQTYFKKSCGAAMPYFVIFALLYNYFALLCNYCPTFALLCHFEAALPCNNISPTLLLFCPSL